MKKEHVKLDSRIGCRIITTNLSKPVYIEPHIHQEIEICLSIEGEKIQIVDGIEYRLLPGDILLMNSNVPHEIKTLSKVKSIVIMLGYGEMLKFCTDLKNIYFDLERDQKSKNKIVTIMNELYDDFIDNDEIIIHFDDSSYNKIGQNSGFEYIRIKSDILKIIYLLLNNHLCVKTNRVIIKNQEKVMQIINYIDANYSKNLTLKEIAFDLGYSPYYISRIFKEYTKINLFDYLYSVRMISTLNMMKKSSASMKEIVTANGFSDYKSFQRTFKKNFFITPTKYRNKNSF